jgi:hypothetical protein
MTVPAKKSRLHPKRWHVATWLLLLLWLTVSIVGNFPQQASTESLDINQPAGVSMTWISGFPLFYYQQQMDLPSPKITTTIHYHWLLANVALSIALLASIIYCLQRFGQFSIRTLLCGMALVAVLIVAGKFVASNSGLVGFYFYMTSIYCMPLLLAIVVAVTVKVRQLRRPTREPSDPAGEPSDPATLG